jgi:voltage-gated potassium channel
MKNSTLWMILHKMRLPFLVIVVSYTISIIGLLLIEGRTPTGEPYHMKIFEAFYFVTYTATTIGFGETPYEFTYDQRLWVSAMIYLSVISWFYAVGTLVSLVQDKLFLSQIKQSRFKHQVGNLQEKFIIVLGYNYTTSEIIKIINNTDFRVVVVEQDQQKVDNLILENFTPPVPVVQANSYDAQILEIAGIKSKYCKAVVSLYKDDALNLRIGLASKMLNPYVTVAAKSTTQNHTDNLLDLGVEVVENPFKIIASHMNLALNSPNILKLERWIYQIGKLDEANRTLPVGNYIICGYGRFGELVGSMLEKNGIDVQFIEIDPDRVKEAYAQKDINLLRGNSDDQRILKKAGIDNAVAIIAGTDDDTTNISILKTAKKLNNDIITIARENKIEDFSIFNNANIDHVVVPSKILINKTTNALTKPSADHLIRHMSKKDEQWGQSLVKRLITTIGANPMLYVIQVKKDTAPALMEEISKGNKLTLDIFSKSLYNRKQDSSVVPLMIFNKQSKKEIVVPDWDEVLEENDRLLFACDEFTINDLEDIAQNYYELHYILTGEEKSLFKFKKGRK